jgi:hypothetical protein
MDPEGTNPQYGLLNEDGSFEVELTADVNDVATGSYGVVTYGAGGAVNADQETFTAMAFAEPMVASVAVSKVTGLTDGETVTVTGTGFDPSANIGTRPPLQGEPSGIYVAFGRYGDPWRPSDDAGSSARANGATVWLLPQASLTVMDPDGTNPSFGLLNEDGSFEVELTADVNDVATGSYGVVTYGAGGAVNADQETFTAMAFADTTTPTVPTDPDPDPVDPVDPITVEGGHLDWGVKASFRSYIQGGIAKGTITTDGGATENADGTFRFPVEASKGDVAADGSSVVADFGGSVHFSGHDGALELDISDIVVAVEGEAGSLQADVTSKDLGTGEVATFTDVELATLDLATVTAAVSGTTVTWPNMPATLTEAGVPAFSDFYKAGDALDPATMVLELSEVPDLPAGGTTVDPKVATLDTTSVRAGGQLTVSGTGFTPGEQVEVWLFSDPVWVGTTTATAEGTASLTFTVPLDTPAGLHHVEMKGITSGHVATSPTFQVSAAAAASAVPVSGTLPYTGGDPLPLGVAAVLLLGIGTALAVGTRRRLATSAEG